MFGSCTPKRANSLASITTWGTWTKRRVRFPFHHAICFPNGAWPLFFATSMTCRTEPVEKPCFHTSVAVVDCPWDPKKDGPSCFAMSKSRKMGIACCRTNARCTKGDLWPVAKSMASIFGFAKVDRVVHTTQHTKLVWKEGLLVHWVIDQRCVPLPSGFFLISALL